MLAKKCLVLAAAIRAVTSRSCDESDFADSAGEVRFEAVHACTVIDLQQSTLGHQGIVELAAAITANSSHDLALLQVC